MKKINLDELYPGLENVYEHLCNESETKFDKNKMNLKYMYILVIAIAILTMFFGISTSMLIHEKISFFMKVIVFTFFACVLLPFIYKTKKIPNNVFGIENAILRHIKPDIIRYNEPKINFEDEFIKSDLLNQEYNRYSAKDHYIYSLSDGRLVENVYLEVIKAENRGTKTNYSTIFRGQFIKIKNKYNFKHRIDILKERYENSTDLYTYNNKNSEKTNILLDSSSFEKHFKIYCENENYAYQFLTSDVMELLTSFTNKMNMSLDITLVDDNIYIKLPEQLIGLYSNALNNPLKRSTVEYFVQRIKNSMDFIEEFVKIIEAK